MIVMALGQANAEEDFLAPEQAFKLSAAMASPAELDVHFAIAPGYYMYRKRFAFQADEDGLLGDPQYPEGVMVDDPTFGEVMEIYRQAVTVRIPLQASLPAGERITVQMTSQGCAEAGLCYPPANQPIVLESTGQGYAVRGEYAREQVPGPVSQASLTAESPAQPQSAAGGLSQVSRLNDEGLATYLAQSSWWKIVGLSFVLGVLLSFTPCVLPMVPILLAAIAGQAGARVSRWRGLGLAFVYVLGVSIVYTLLGVAAGLLGAGLAAWLQNPWVLGVFAILLALLGLAMLGVFTVQAPGGVQSYLTERMNRLPGGRHSAVFVMGMLSALIVGPCVAAPLAGVLLFLSQTGDVVLGGSALFALAWGSGVLLLVVGAGSAAVLPRAGAWMNQVKSLFGVLLFATAWWMISPFVAAVWVVLGWALLACWAAVLLGAFASLQAEAGPMAALGKALGLLIALWAALMLVSVALGKPSTLRPLHALSSGLAGGSTAVSAPVFERIKSVEELEQRLAQATRPVMLDFYADWCVSCIEMEQFTFVDAGVAQRMAQFELLQADVTANNEQDRALLQRFKLFGPPGIMFFDAQGQYLPSYRVIGFQNAERFQGVLDAVLAAR
ncbi:protein-disulfide reductase DsbD [Pusillimonas sp. CC-YST705]|uniref:Protein-disulfide reductase DsbD n=1 Tax=Mesopusillimonas faecipullorum TaxID=2755040 RepID=A0ABS8CFQ5_9BURK|nr:protein-disulfide reductase DsbD [Mesopusillimonas faecipullorum]